MSSEREQRYAEAFRDPGAFVARRRIEGVYPSSARTARETLSEWQARAVMSIADAELAKAWLEGHAAGRDYAGDGWNSDCHVPADDNPYAKGRI